VIPVADDAESGIGSIPLGIPDLEGFARLQIYANSTQSQIGCFQAVMSNGQSFSQPQSISAILGGFALLAILASFATAIYGLSIPHMRTHYANSFAVLVIFETYQTIFFSGALSVPWPSVLPAWWSNFAWSAGMVASPNMVESFRSFTGNSGNASQVGGAGSVILNNDGGLRQEIYGRSLDLDTTINLMASRAESQTDYDFSWNGKPLVPGMPMPGTWPGLSGTLSAAAIPPAEAFTIALIWFLVLMLAAVLFVAAAKVFSDFVVRLKVYKHDGLDYFRTHWTGYVAHAVLRVLYIGFFVMTTLALYQFSIDGPAGPTAVAAVVFATLVLGLGGLAAYACFFRLRRGRYQVGSDTLQLESGKLFKTIPFIAATRTSKIGEEEKEAKPRRFGSLPFFRITYVSDDPNQETIHQDEGFIKRFGWLSARYRRTRWWFFAFYLSYQFVRACFIGGGSQTPLPQVFGLFAFEVLALFVIIKLSPFEGNRNTVASVWLLSVAKIITCGLTIALLPEFNVRRIYVTIIGIIIVVVQAFTTLAVLVLTGLGMISTWMSLSRNREKFPRALDNARITYFEHIDGKAKDLPKSQLPEPKPERDITGTFHVKDVRRTSRIDDDMEMTEFPRLEPLHNIPEDNITTDGITNRPSRANSASSRYSTSSLPRAARVHRASWSSRDFAGWDAETNRPSSRRVNHSRSNSLRLQTLNAQGGDAPSIDSRLADTSLRRPMTPARESMEEPRRSISASQGFAVSGSGDKGDTAQFLNEGARSATATARPRADGLRAAEPSPITEEDEPKAPAEPELKLRRHSTG
jgi:hypothetical protein